MTVYIVCLVERDYILRVYDAYESRHAAMEQFTRLAEERRPNHAGPRLHILERELQRA